ncbi:MAG: T9SS type A sorting domain-containing protein [Ginsengibacter sp.]
MRRFFTLACSLSLLFSSQVDAQLLQASLGMGSGGNRVKIYIRSNTTMTTNISTLEFNIGSPVSVTIPQPTVVSAAAGITWTISPLVVEGGYNNYAITTNLSPLQIPLTAGADYQVMELDFGSHNILDNEIALITLPDGGTDRFELFYSTGSPESDGSNLYYAITPAVTVDNKFSYDISGTPPGTGISTATITAVALPVKLSAFNINLQNNNSVLNWTAQNQDVNSGVFEIERSTNGRDFNRIGNVVAGNNPNQDYSYVDRNVSMSGKIYYRLKMIDKDGHFSYSEIKVIHSNGKNFTAALYPNPVVNSARLSFFLENSTLVKVSVTDALGKQIKHMEFNGLKGQNEKTIDLSSVNPGAYMVKIWSGDKSETISLIKN